MLTNYKTYIVVAALIGVALVEGVAGIDIPGVQLEQNWVEVLLGALGLGALRAAIGKK